MKKQLWVGKKVTLFPFIFGPGRFMDYCENGALNIICMPGDLY